MLNRLGAAKSGDARTLIRCAAVALVLALCAYLGPRTSARTLALLVGGLTLVALIGRLQGGLVLLIPAGLVVPFSLGTGSQTEIPVTLILLAALLALWVLDMVRRRELRLAESPANLPWLLLIVVAGLSIVIGDAFWNPLVETKGNFQLVQLAQWSVFIFSAGAYWLVGRVVHEVRWLKWMVGTFLSFGSLYLLLRLVTGSSSGAARLFVPGSTGSVFWVWMAALAGGQVLFNRRLLAGPRLVLGAVVFAALAVAWFQSRSWVSGWAPPAVSLLVLAWLRSPRLGLTTTLGGGVAVRLAAPFFYANVVERAVTEGSFLRIPAWQGIFALVGRRWPIGLGLAAYWHYWRALLMTWVWSSTNVVQLTLGTGVNSHNNYVDIFAQMGAVGLLIFVWLVLALWRQGWRLREAVPDGFERGYVYGCLAGLAGTLASGMLADWFLPFVYNVGIAGMRSSILAWLFLGGLVVLAKVGGQAETGPDAA